VDVGDRLVYFFEGDGTIRLKSAEKVAEALYGLFADRFPERDSVQELLDERRREVAREGERG
jgi:hypothetical protein